MISVYLFDRRGFCVEFQDFAQDYDAAQAYARAWIMDGCGGESFDVRDTCHESIRREFRINS